MPINQSTSVGLKKCFVCGNAFELSEISINKQVNMPVCSTCQGSDQEKQKENEHLDCLGSGFTVGCIS